MADFDLDAVLELAKESGRLARGYFGNVKAQRKSDSTLVTRADREVEEIVRARLAEITPGWPVLGEEAGRGGDEIDRAGPYWVVDPVDGTSSFISGLPCWCFSLGLVVENRPVFGVIELPMTGETFHTDTDGTAVYLNGQTCPADEPLDIDSESVLYVPSDSHRGYGINFPGKVRSLGSAAYHGILAGRGRTAGALHGRIYQWDAAGCMAIARAWGLRVGYLDGSEVTLDDWELQGKCPGPMLFAHRKHFDYISGAIELLYGRKRAALAGDSG